MTGFKPRSSAVGSDHAVNCATPIAQVIILLVISYQSSRRFVRGKNNILEAFFIHALASKVIAFVDSVVVDVFSPRVVDVIKLFWMKSRLPFKLK